MSNPDERTTIDQFGSGDKCFGVATVMATMPGLPMFGHGQIEGYTERYGMEFKMPKFREEPDEHLVARHMAEIAPLLKDRHIFAESANFVLYDFWTGYGVNENVFAYSNRNGNDRSIILYNNSYTSTSGSIKVSAASMDKGSGELRQRTLSEGLDLPGDGGAIVAFRDRTRGLEFLRRAGDLRDNGYGTEPGPGAAQAALPASPCGSAARAEPRTGGKLRRSSEEAARRGCQSGSNCT